MVFTEADVVFSYTRREALEDGVLYDLNKIIPIEESGYKYPIACTATVWGIINKVAKSKTTASSIEGIVWDILWMSQKCKKKEWKTGCLFQVKIGKSWKMLKIECGPGDNGEPVLTIMFPEED